jgi:restriction system protein
MPDQRDEPLSFEALARPIKQAFIANMVAIFNDKSRGEKPVKRRPDGLFDPGSVAWRVHSDVTPMMVGSIAGLLLQYGTEDRATSMRARRERVRNQFGLVSRRPLPVLLASTIGEVRIGEVVDRLAEQLNLTSEDRAQLLPSGKQTLLGNRVHWAKTYLTKSGLLESTRRGHFRITERGLQVIASHPSRIDNDFLNQFAEFRQIKEKSASDAAPGAQLIEPPLVSRAETPDEVMRAAHKQVEISLGQDLLDRIRSSPPAFFERLIVNLLLAMGYGGSATDAGRAIGRSGDDGVDGVIDQDALGLDRVYIQAKRYAAGNSRCRPEINPAAAEAACAHVEVLSSVKLLVAALLPYGVTHRSG